MFRRLAIGPDHVALLATLVIVARLQHVASWMAVQDMPERSIPAMPSLRELKKVPTPGCGQAWGKPARSRGAYNAPVVVQ
jgi:hypothetical protein